MDFAATAGVYSKARKAFKGNIDPVADMLFATPEECLAKARKCVGAASGLQYMLSPGCEVPAEMNDDVFRAFCSAVQLRI